MLTYDLKCETWVVTYIYCLSPWSQPEVKHYTNIHLEVDKLRAYMESAMCNHIHIDNKLPGSGKEDLDCIKAYIMKEKSV